MADLTYTASLEDKISPTLKKIEANVSNLRDKFSGLQAALAGLAIGATISNVVRLADSIQDVSDATGIAIQNILGFQNAVMLNGGTAEQAQTSIFKLVQSIGEAAGGGRNAQLAFQEVGITLQDLATLSEQDILAKTIQGLNQIDDAGQRAVVITELLGKGFRGINVQGVAGQLGAATTASLQYVQAIQQTAEMQNKLDIAMQRLQLAVLKAIQPLIEFINKLDDEKLGNFIDTVIDLGSKLAALTVAIYAIEKAINVFKYAIVGLAGAFALWKVGTATAAAGLALLVTNLKTVGNILKNVAMLWMIPFTSLIGILGRVGTTITALIGSAGSLYAAFKLIGAGLLRMIPLVGSVGVAFIALNEIVKSLTETSIAGWIGKGIDKLKEFVGLQKKVAEGPDQSEAETQRLARQNKAAEQQATKVREVEDAFLKQRKQIEMVSEAFKRQNDQVLRGIGFEQTLIGKSEDYQEVLRAQQDVLNRANIEVQKLRDAKNNLNDSEKSLAVVYDQQIAKIQEQAKVDAQRVASAVSGLQGIKLLEQDRLNSIERINQALQKQATYDESILDIRRQAQEALSQAEFEGAQIQRTPLEQKIEEIKRNAEKAARDAGRAFAAQFEGLELSTQDAQRLADGLDLIAQKYKAIADQQMSNLESSRSFATGWKNAFNEYLDNGTNAAKRAGEAFRTVTSNMESAIDKFVETGKFSFSDFARSVIQDLIKIELKAQATQLLKGAMSAGGSFLGSLLGFANGGNPPVNKPSIVGEKGPELFIPRTAGTIVPNDKLGMGGTQQTVNNNYVYNVSAIDAKSVAEFFAANRKTMLGTIQLAQKELPYGNR